MSFSSADWATYPWKNELSEQAKRVQIHLAEAIDEDYAGDANPHHMLERALMLAAFSVRRMAEKRLLTDEFNAKKFAVRSFKAKNGDFRPNYVRSSGSYVYRNYDLTRCETIFLKASEIANEIIHSSLLMVACSNELVGDGLLIASDWHAKHRFLHMTAREIETFFKDVYDDRVYVESDEWEPVTGKVMAKRLGRGELAR